MSQTKNDDRTYWNNKGKYQKESDTLQKLVPDSGEASDTKIDLFRRASNLYYEIFNNGGDNLQGEDNDFEVIRLVHEGFSLPIVTRMIKESNELDSNYEMIGDPDKYFEQAQVEMENLMDQIIQRVVLERKIN